MEFGAFNQFGVVAESRDLRLRWEERTWRNRERERM